MPTKNQYFFLCILFFVTNISAQRDDFTPNPYEVNRIFFYSSSAPITKALNQITPSVAQNVQVILGYVDFVEKQVLTSLATGKQVKPDNINRLCTLNDPLLNNSIFRSFGLRGLPDPDRGCITQVSAEDDSLTTNPPYNLDELYNAVNERGITLNRNMKAIASRFIDVENNFTGAETPHGFVYNRDSTRCVLHSACAIREGPDWRIGTPVHNKFKYESVPDFGRQVINEYARSVDGRLEDPLRMRLQEFRIDDLPREIRARSTTYIKSGSRNAHPNCFRREPISHNPAMLNALSKVEQELTYAEDVVKPSTIAILVFPLGFNLVPISLLAEVSRPWLLFYILLSDVLTCIPLFMRGLELLSLERNPKRAFAVRLTAPLNGTRSASAAAEIWGAECRAPRQIRQTGMVFVVVAVLFMVGGVVAEMVAKRFAKRHKWRSLQAAYSGTGRSLGVWVDQDATERMREESETNGKKSTQSAENA